MSRARPLSRRVNEKHANATGLRTRHGSGSGNGGPDSRRRELFIDSFLDEEKHERSRSGRLRSRRLTNVCLRDLPRSCFLDPRRVVSLSLSSCFEQRNSRPETNRYRHRLDDDDGGGSTVRQIIYGSFFRFLSPRRARTTIRGGIVLTRQSPAKNYEFHYNQYI